MKQLLLTSFGLLILMSTSYSQVNIQWEARHDYLNQTDFAKGIVIDATGNSYVTGTAFNGSNFDIVTVKYDADGGFVWSNIYNGPANGWDDATGIVINSNNDVIIGGFHQVSGSDYDIFCYKLNGTTGLQDWLYTYNGTANFDLCNAITIDNNDNVILGGAREVSATNKEFVTISVSPTGVQNWLMTYTSGTNRDVINDVTTDDLNNVYVTGESWGGGNNLDYYTIKYTPAGAQIWARRFDGANSIDIPKAITVDNNGNTYVVGTSYRNVTIEEDIMLIRMDNNGIVLWNSVYGGTSQDFDSPSDVQVDDFGNIYVAGKVKNLGHGEDFLIARYRPNGQLHWDYIYQSPTNGYDEAKRVFINSDFEVFASGYSNITGNNDDYITVKIDTLGNEEWFTRFNGPASASDQMVDFKVDIDGNIFVTGSSVGNGTNRDYSTIKYCQLQTIATASELQICIGESVQLNSTGGFNFEWNFVSGDPITGANFSCTSCDNPIATPNQTTTYTVTSENAAGCVDTDTITIVVNPLPGPVISTNGPTEFCDGGDVTLTADFAAAYNWDNGQTTQSIYTDTSGVYVLTITDAMGCQNFTSIEVIVNPLPVVNGGPDRFRCPGVPITLNATGADSLAWFRLPTPSSAITNGVPFTPASSGSYMVVGIDENGCQDRDTIQITIYPFPSQIEITQGMSGFLFVNLSDGTTDWSLDGNSLNHSGTSFFYEDSLYCSGLYSVVYTDENGCQTTDELEVITNEGPCDSTISVDQFNQESFNIFPNPTIGEVTIQFESVKDRTIHVQNTQGQIVYSSTSLNDNYYVDLSQLAKGTYMIVIMSDNSVIRSRVIKQ